jgi:hypothetical protein
MAGLTDENKKKSKIKNDDLNIDGGPIRLVCLPSLFFTTQKQNWGLKLSFLFVLVIQSLVPVGYATTTGDINKSF